jgi:hypothetical protein
MQLCLFDAQALEAAQREGCATRVCRTCKQEKPLPEFATRYGEPTSWCLHCKRSYWRDKGYGAAYRARNREHIRQYNRKWRAAHSDKNKEWDLRALYGLTLVEYHTLLEQQGGVCAICRQPETTSIRGKLLKLAVDHDHANGRVRGLLCRRCNTVLGHLDERIEIARAMIDYLEKHPGETIDGEPHSDGCCVLPLQGHGPGR